MKFIKKQLQEDYTSQKQEETPAEEVEQKAESKAKDEEYKQAILTAIGSETGAWNEYNTILEMESEVSQDLVKQFHDTIEDIRNEEMKHVGQLTTKVSELPDMKAAYDAGKIEAENGEEESLSNEKKDEEPKEEEKEEVKESVVLTESVVEKTPDNTRRFDSDTIFELILNNFTLDDSNETIIYRLFNEGEELTAEEVDEKLATVQQILHISPENMEALEALIIKSKDPVVDRIQEFRLDIDNDIGMIKDLLENIQSQAAASRLEAVIEELKALEYNGDKDTGWLKSNTLLGDHPMKKVIS